MAETPARPLTGGDERKEITDGTQCPWCERWALKDQACNHVVCGVDTLRGFVPGQAGATAHSAACCPAEAGFVREEYCPGGHNSHTPARW